jgi:hypothetical protein
MAPDLPPGMTRQAAAAWIGEDPQAADKVFRDLMSASTGTRRAVQNGMFTFACPSPAAWFPAAPDYTLAGVCKQTAARRWSSTPGAERAFKGQARTLYDAHLPQGIPDVHRRGRAPRTTARWARRCLYIYALPCISLMVAAIAIQPFHSYRDPVGYRALVAASRAV